MIRTAILTVVLAGMSAPAWADAPAVVPPIDQRFAPDDVDETPDFQRHVVPLLGRLGCNSRSCHGSFQGQGGFRLSLFGYDFKMDHEGLSDRVDTEAPDESYALEKPLLRTPHRGGKRFEEGSWEHHVFLKWIGAGAKGLPERPAALQGLEVTPSEIVFSRGDQKQALRAVAIWSDGTREDVTPLCRYQSNDEQVAGIDQNGLVSSGEPGDTHVVVFYDNAVVPVPVMRPVSPLTGQKYPPVATRTEIDRLVVEKLRKLGVVPAEVCTDAEFLRRVSLDVTGTLPTAREVEQFLADTSSDKRSRKIDELLDRPTYAAWWTTRLCDITGNNDDALVNVTPNRGQASQDWYNWIYRRVADNVPYDELMAGIALGIGRENGQSYLDYARQMSEIYRPGSGASYADRQTLAHFWARRTLRQPEERALAFAYTFMGIRIQCAQCHKHPFDQWTQDDYQQFQRFFTRVSFGQNRESRAEAEKLMAELGLQGQRGNDLRRSLPELLRKGKTVPFDEVYIGDARGGRNRDGAGSGETAKLLGGEVVDLSQYKDPREPLVTWLRDKNNYYFARAFVNRVWAAYFHRGIVEPPDDHSLANPPSNKPLLDYLTQAFIEHGYDMKWLHKEIVSSDTYQRSWQPNDTNRLEEKNFSRAVPRRLPAEVAYDAIRLATASDERAQAMQTSPEGRAIFIAGAGVRNAQTGTNYALQIFGKSLRESNCDCDRSNEPSLLQTVFLQNDQELLELLDGNRNSWMYQLQRQLSGEPAPAARAEARRRPRDYDRQIAQLKRAIERAEADGNQRLADESRARLEAYQARFESPAPPRDQPQRAQAALGADELVREAYLRTLSRYPVPEELHRARQFVQESEDPLEGVRGLLWALLNTKEFIVNH